MGANHHAVDDRVGHRVLGGLWVAVNWVSAIYSKLGYVIGATPVEIPAEVIDAVCHLSIDWLDVHVVAVDVEGVEGFLVELGYLEGVGAVGVFLAANDDVGVFLAANDELQLLRDGHHNLRILSADHILVLGLDSLILDR